VVEAVQGGEHIVDAEARLLSMTHAEVGALVAIQWNFAEALVEVIRDHHGPPPGAYLAHLIHLCDMLVRARMPNGPADENMAFVLGECPSFREVFGKVEELDQERLTFSIDDELERAITFVQLAFQD
jgi:HD-like signal output (HDOD) protein